MRGSKEGVTREAIRLPLDVPRGRVKGPKWKGISLEPFTTASHEDLLKCYKVLQEVQDQTRSVMPVLMDENIHYRLLKWMYSVSYAHLAVRETMGQLVLVYGVWHAYKNVCLHIHRAFFPVWVYLERGVLKKGEAITSSQKLAYIERLIAGLWIVGADYLVSIDTEINRMMALLGRVQTRKNGEF